MHSSQHLSLLFLASCRSSLSLLASNQITLPFPPKNLAFHSLQAIASVCNQSHQVYSAATSCHFVPPQAIATSLFRHKQSHHVYSAATSCLLFHRKQSQQIFHFATNILLLKSFVLPQAIPSSLFLCRCKHWRSSL